MRNEIEFNCFFPKGLRSSLDNLNARSEQCAAKETELSRLNPEYRRKYVHAAQVHANHLWQQAQFLFGYFSSHFYFRFHPIFLTLNQLEMK